MCVLAGSRFSLECSIDEVSSLGGGVGGSRASLANTSLTSAADLSTLSSVTLARRGDVDAASLQSGRSVTSADARSIQSVRSPRSPTDRFRRSEGHSPASAPLSHHTNGETVSLPGGDDVEEAVHNGLPASPPSTPRPSCLSVSQTTLQEKDNLLSEPATPKASETPDTVRIFVPYSGNDPPLSPSSAPLPSVPPPLQGLKHSPTSSPGDPNRIMIHVDGDESLSSPRDRPGSAPCSSPRDLPGSPRGQDYMDSSQDLSTTPSTIQDLSFPGQYSSGVIEYSPPVSPTPPKLETARSRPITLDSPEYKEGLL
ncbi:hypothetical protein Pcinc_011210 [Petrolisthes cinctipes]|uniref:Uncharacterized protein n=1 Tax=Petrolisthes cinctipes TaxID=88211 RepID=A0AAE1G418_PETCI|nr:hypothetical protein Pcinc_011210 [Petrolisthes cinctipes]